MQREEFSFSLPWQLGGWGLVAAALFLAWGMIDHLFLPSMNYLYLGMAVLWATPLLILGFYLAVRHSGQVVLTEDAVVLQRFGQEQRMIYLEIAGFQSFDGHFPPHFILKAGDGRTMKFSRQMPDFKEFHSALGRPVSFLKGKKSAQLPVEMDSTLAILRNSVVFLLLYLGGGVMMALGTVESQRIIVPGGMFALVSLMAMFATIRGITTGVRLNFDCIEVGRILLPSRIIPLKDIARIVRRQVLVGKGSKNQGVNWKSQWHVFIEFQDESIRPIGWDETLMESWGYTSQGFWVMLTESYCRYVKCEVISLS